MSEPNGSKTCRTCETVKPLTDYYASKNHSSGYESRCKACGLAANKEWRDANVERIAERKRQYHTDNAERLIAYTAKWAKENNERVAAWARDRRQRHPGIDNETRRKRREVDGERRRSVERAWREAHPESVARISHNAASRRRAQIFGTRVGLVDLAALWTSFCGICSESLDPDLRHPDPLSKSVDHIIPLAKGGSHTQDNLQWAHLICNISKGDRFPEAS